MTVPFAGDMVTWRYPAPYDLYDMTGADPGFFANPASGYFALTEGDELIGFRSFGQDGQVPGGSYDSSALDTGGGLRPDLTGQGLGGKAISTGLEFGHREFASAAFRVTVASFNERALRVVRSLGFRAVGSFLAAADGRGFEILVRPESAGDWPAAGRPAARPDAPPVH
jgi:[ribosomal protein S18]-alanine N-acetyltransferase